MKIVLLFPGIGYRFDKPLLKYSKEIAMNKGYEVIEVSYTRFLSDLQGNRERIVQSVSMCLEECETLLKDVNFSQYDSIVCISKSIGTIISSAYMHRHVIQSTNILLTPLHETFAYSLSGYIFHGTSDPWMDHAQFKEDIQRQDVTYYVYKDANHSLVCKDENVSNTYLTDVLEKIDQIL